MKRWEAERLVRTVYDPPPTELVDHVVSEVSNTGRRGSYRWRALRHLLSQGVAPSEELVRDRLEEMRARAAERAEGAPLVAAQAQARAREFVRAHRDERGSGPTWAELRSYLGVNHGVGNRVIEILIAEGTLTGTPEPRSLDVPPLR